MKNDITSILSSFWWMTFVYIFLLIFSLPSDFLFRFVKFIHNIKKERAGEGKLLIRFSPSFFLPWYIFLNAVSCSCWWFSSPHSLLGSKFRITASFFKLEHFLLIYVSRYVFRLTWIRGITWFKVMKYFYSRDFFIHEFLSNNILWTYKNFATYYFSDTF